MLEALLNDNEEEAVKNFSEALDVKGTVIINELSKKTLGSYIDKAVDEVGTNSYIAGANKVTKAKNKKATMIPGPEEFEKKSNKRQKGIKLAVKKLVKDE